MTRPYKILRGAAAGEAPRSYSAAQIKMASILGIHPDQLPDDVDLDALNEQSESVTSMGQPVDKDVSTAPVEYTTNINTSAGSNTQRASKSVTHNNTPKSDVVGPVVFDLGPDGGAARGWYEAAYVHNRYLILAYRRDRPLAAFIPPMRVPPKQPISVLLPDAPYPVAAYNVLPEPVPFGDYDVCLLFIVPDDAGTMR